MHGYCDSLREEEVMKTVVMNTMILSALLGAFSIPRDKICNAILVRGFCMLHDPSIAEKKFNGVESSLTANDMYHS